MMRRLTEQELRELSGKIIDVLPDGVDPLDWAAGLVNALASVIAMHAPDSEGAALGIASRLLQRVEVLQRETTPTIN
jgi:hypothetical protein